LTGFLLVFFKGGRYQALYRPSRFVGVQQTEDATMTHYDISPTAIDPGEDGLPRSGFVRLKQILAPHGPLPISRSSWFSGQARGIYPLPVRLSERISAYRVRDVRALIERLDAAGADSVKAHN
jgi:hypothetical protein